MVLDVRLQIFAVFISVCKKNFLGGSMAAKCQISKKSNQHGNRVSHAKNRRKHKFKPNLQSKKIYIPEEGRTVRVKVSTRVIRTIDKLGLKGTLKKYGLELSDIL